jgi:flagellar biosynthesis protein FliR
MTCTILRHSQISVAVRFFTAVKISIVVFWVVTLHSLVGDYQRFGGLCCLNLHGMEAVVSSETFVTWSDIRVGNPGI